MDDSRLEALEVLVILIHHECSKDALVFHIYKLYHTVLELFSQMLVCRKLTYQLDYFLFIIVVLNKFVWAGLLSRMFMAAVGRRLRHRELVRGELLLLTVI